MSTAIQFGAGNIGRGFLAQLFHESWLEVVFVDVVESVIEAINARRAYRINIVGEGAQSVPIDKIRAIHSRSVGEIAAEIAGSEIVCTAVGANALPFTAPAIAAGLEIRYAAGAAPLNILLCENLHNAAYVLRSHVAERLAPERREAILARTGFVQTVVSRMVPVQTEEDRRLDPLGVRVEAYRRLPVDAEAWVGPLDPRSIVGLEPVAPFAAYVDRKLFTHNCAHAVLGYLGFEAGHRYGYEALHDSAIAAELDEVLDETGRALIRKHGLDALEHAAHVADLLKRFDNRDLGDTCIRLARDPLRKLAPDDRIVGAARCCEQQGVTPSGLAHAINAALNYDDAADPSAVEMQRMLKNDGRAKALERICAILPDEPLAQLISRAEREHLSRKRNGR